MRFLIIAAVLACANAAPSGLLAAPYGHGLIGHGAPLAYGHAAPLAYGHAAPLAVTHAAVPTISPGDIQGAAIDAHVEAADHVRAAVDATREHHDQAAELHGQAINAAEDHSWQAVDAVKTHEAQVDGATAGVAPILAKQLAGHAGVYAAAAPLAHAAYAAPVAHAAYAAPLAHAGAIAHAGSHSVSSQSLHQTHPAPLVHAPVLAHAAPVAYAAHGHAGLAHGLAHW
ncbi:pupal cuticle protein PCP52-like [Leguminivora glycinivorella]|uniref:pupal cuticle protein PCP52-like n=1 Tax=Leguminivora glycinivorella TaxID=1035111 RepID=UPI00200C6C1B|nr:pupal cuticle protein PCP52-like [Leguminivora glycinivorella]